MESIRTAFGNFAILNPIIHKGAATTKPSSIRIIISIQSFIVIPEKIFPLNSLRKTKNPIIDATPNLKYNCW